jgi:hypothetical protein
MRPNVRQRHKEKLGTAPTQRRMPEHRRKHRCRIENEKNGGATVECDQRSEKQGRHTEADQSMGTQFRETLHSLVSIQMLHSIDQFRRISKSQGCSMVYT